MKLFINPSTAVGEVDAPISKSHLHRLLIAVACLVAKHRL